jgi:hypothetical protein
MEEMRDPYKFLVRKPYGKDQLGDLGIEGRITFKNWVSR